MRKIVFAALMPMLALAVAACDQSSGDGNGAAGAKKSSADSSNPALNAPDQVAWELFLTAVSTPDGGTGPTFETWASDTDTFSQSPTWPGERKAVQPRRFRPTQQMGLGKAHAFAVDAPPPAEAGAGDGNVAAPALQPGTLHHLQVEEVRRNQAAFQYIKDNGLNTRSGLIKAYGKTISFPADSIELKTNWLTPAQVTQYYPSRVTGDIKSNFYTVNDSNGNPQWVLVSMHVISKQVPNWTWATFEHNANPGRCDIIGCYDSFGAQQAQVVPAATPEGDYGPCAQTQALADMMKGAGVFNNYCLKGTQTDFTDPTGLVIRLGNSITEGGFVDSSSCMTCHGTAGWDAKGMTTNDTAPIGPIPWQTFWGGSNPPLKNGQNQQIATAADFVWSIPFCAYDDVNGGGAQCTGSR